MTPGDKKKIKILSSTEDLWLVETQFSDEDFDGDALLKKIREIKEELSAEIKVPVDNLKYSEILTTTPTDKGVLVTFNIVREES